MKIFNVSVILLLIFMGHSAWAEEPVSTGYFNSIAIGGHDVTGYRGLAIRTTPPKGSAKHMVEWKGAEWHFLSETDKQLFAANPEKYVPAYNGHCANALSLGEGLVQTNGKHWAIFDDKLYLFYAHRGASRWLDGDYQEYKKQADAAWAKIVGVKAKAKVKAPQDVQVQEDVKTQEDVKPQEDVKAAT